jgi:ferredoxin
MIKLFCFTGTGNSLAAARQLTEMLKDDCRIEMMTDLINQHIIEPEADCIGLIFPVYAWSIPKLVKRFVRRLHISPETYVFAIYTSSGSPGATGLRLRKMLSQKKVDLNAGFNLTMPSNYTPFGLLTEKKCKLVLARAKKKLHRIANSVAARKNNRIDRTPLFWPLTAIINPLFMSQLNSQHTNFKVNDTCCACGLCENLCPNENINLEDGKPVWGKNCDLCLACLHWCPVKAIEYGRVSRNGKRYHHPDVNVYDLIPPEKRRRKHDT